MHLLYVDIILRHPKEILISLGNQESPSAWHQGSCLKTTLSEVTLSHVSGNYTHLCIGKPHEGLGCPLWYLWEGEELGKTLRSLLPFQQREASQLWLLNNMGVHTLVHWKLTIRQPGRMIRHVCTSQWWGHVKRSWLREPGLPGIVQHKHPLQTIHTFTHTLSNPYRHLRSMELILVQEPDFK